MEAIAPGRLLVTMDEAAKILALPRTKMWVLMGQGEIKTVKFGRSRRVSVKELERVIEQREAASGDERA